GRAARRAPRVLDAAVLDACVQVGGPVARPAAVDDEARRTIDHQVEFGEVAVCDSHLHVVTPVAQRGDELAADLDALPGADASGTGSLPVGVARIHGRAVLALEAEADDRV